MVDRKKKSGRGGREYAKDMGRDCCFVSRDNEAFQTMRALRRKETKKEQIGLILQTLHGRVGRIDCLVHKQQQNMGRFFVFGSIAALVRWRCNFCIAHLATMCLPHKRKKKVSTAEKIIVSTWLYNNTWASPTDASVTAKSYGERAFLPMAGSFALLDSCMVPNSVARDYSRFFLSFLVLRPINGALVYNTDGQTRNGHPGCALCPQPTLLLLFWSKPHANGPLSCFR